MSLSYVEVNPNGVRVATPLVVCRRILTVPTQAEYVVVFARVYGVCGLKPWDFVVYDRRRTPSQPIV